jgi:ribosome-binding factor A
MRKFAKVDKVADLLKHAISNALLKELEDERLRWVTIVEVRVSQDLEHARVFYSVLDPPLARADAATALGENAKGIRRYVAQNLRLRQAPELRFEFDETEERARRIEEILRDIGSDGRGTGDGT